MHIIPLQLKSEIWVANDDDSTGSDDDYRELQNGQGSSDKVTAMMYTSPFDSGSKGEPQCSLRIIPVILTNPDTERSKIYNVLLIDGSEISMLSDCVGKELELQSQPVKMWVSGILEMTKKVPAYEMGVLLSVSHENF